MKRILSLLLVAVMLVGLFPSTLAADSNPEPRSLNATELTGLSRLDEEKQEPAENRQETPGYQPEDLVTVIVTLTDEPVLAGFDRSSVSGISAGEAVSRVGDPAVTDGQRHAEGLGLIFLKLHGDVRVELLKGRKYPGKQVSSEVHGNAEGELSAAHLTVFVQIDLQAFAAVEDLSCGI